MKFIISGKNVEVTDALKERLTKKLQKLEKFFNPDTEVHATFSTEKNKHIIEITIPFNGTVFRAEEKNDDMFTSIDKIVDILEGQIRKNKTKVQKKVKGSGMNNLPSIEANDEKDDDRLKIHKFKKYSVKPMPLEEAIMQINLSEKEFLAFFNVDAKQVNVVYKLKTGGYGLVEPEL